MLVSHKPKFLKNSDKRVDNLALVPLFKVINPMHSIQLLSSYDNARRLYTVNAYISHFPLSSRPSTVLSIYQGQTLKQALHAHPNSPLSNLDLII